MTTNAEIERELMKQTLRLVRVANGISDEARTQLMMLGREIRSSINSADSPMTRATMNRIISTINERASAIYSTIAGQHVDAIGRVIKVDSRLMRNIANLPEAPTDAALRRAEGRMLIQGASAEQRWLKQRDDLTFRVTSELRSGVASNLDNPTISKTIVGSGSQQRGGVMELFRRRARTLVHDGINSAANAGRQATLKANKVKVQRWTAILDPSVCPHCAVRDGKLFDLEGQPVGHALPKGDGPPLHPNCRCLLIPELYPDEPAPTDSGKQGNRGENFLKRLTKSEQESILGVGRTELFRRGNITLKDLIDQRGFVMPLNELERLF